MIFRAIGLLIVTLKFQELITIAHEWTQRLRDGDQEEYKHSLAQADLSRAKQAIGLSEAEAEELDQRLESAANALLIAHPELADFLPRRSLVDDPRALAISLEKTFSD